MAPEELYVYRALDMSCKVAVYGSRIAAEGSRGAVESSRGAVVGSRGAVDCLQMSRLQTRVVEYHNIRYSSTNTEYQRIPNTNE